MKSKKLMRILSGLVSGAMLLSLCACGGSGGSGAKESPAPAATEAAKDAGSEAVKEAGTEAAASGFQFDHRIEIMVTGGEG